MFVVLDLDLTLIKAESISLTSTLVVPPDSFLFTNETHHDLFLVKKRKNLDEFIDTLIKRNIQIIVWSAGSDHYVKGISEILFGRNKLTYILTKNHLVNRVKKLGEISKFVPDFNIDKCFLIDDNDIHQEDQEKNFIFISEMTDNDDNALIEILDKLVY